MRRGDPTWWSAEHERAFRAWARRYIYNVETMSEGNEWRNEWQVIQALRRAYQAGMRRGNVTGIAAALAPLTR